MQNIIYLCKIFIYIYRYFLFWNWDEIWPRYVHGEIHPTKSFDYEASSTPRKTMWCKQAERAPETMFLLTNHSLNTISNPTPKIIQLWFFFSYECSRNNWCWSRNLSSLLSLWKHCESQFNLVYLLRWSSRKRKVTRLGSGRDSRRFSIQLSLATLSERAAE